MDTTHGTQEFTDKRFCLDCDTTIWHRDGDLSGWNENGKYKGHRLVEIPPARFVSFGGQKWLFIETKMQLDAFVDILNFDFGGFNLPDIRALPFPFWLTARTNAIEQWNSSDGINAELIALTPEQISELFGATQALAGEDTDARARRDARAQGDAPVGGKLLTQEERAIRDSLRDISAREKEYRAQPLAGEYNDCEGAALQ